MFNNAVPLLSLRIISIYTSKAQIGYVFGGENPWIADDGCVAVIEVAWVDFGIPKGEICDIPGVQIENDRVG